MAVKKVRFCDVCQKPEGPNLVVSRDFAFMGQQSDGERYQEWVEPIDVCEECENKLKWIEKEILGISPERRSTINNEQLRYIIIAVLNLVDTARGLSK